MDWTVAAVNALDEFAELTGLGLAGAGAEDLTETLPVLAARARSAISSLMAPMGSPRWNAARTSGGKGSAGLAICVLRLNARRFGYAP